MPAILDRPPVEWLGVRWERSAYPAACFPPPGSGYPAVVTVSGQGQPADGRVLVVPSLPASVSAIRRFAVSACAAALPADVRDTVELLVSEVATNALVHGRGEVHVQVRTGPSVVRVEVSDESPRPPVPRAAGTDGEDGRGMALVDALSSGWGTLPRPPGKTVWFEVQP